MTPPAVLKKGTILANRYEITEALGQGGFGEVVAARDRTRDRLVAVKVLHQDAQEADPRAALRMRQEAEILRSINHPNIVEILEVGQFDGGQFLVMELIDGTGLDEVFANEPVLSTPRVLTITWQLLSALGAVHEASILHRDLKPENILIVSASDREVVKLVDFGVAKIEEIQGDDPDDAITLVKTRVGSFVGTPRYAAPEVVVGDPAEPSADLFCVGLIVYEALTGKPLINGKSHSELMHELVFPRPFDLGEVPANWVPWLEQMLEKSPDRRPQSSADALRLLAEIFPPEEYDLPSLDVELDRRTDEFNASTSMTNEDDAEDALRATSTWEPLELDYDAITTIEKPRPLTATPLAGDANSPQEKKRPAQQTPRESNDNLLLYVVVGFVGVLFLVLLYFVFSGTFFS